MYIIIIILTFISFFIPNNLFAWGGITHLLLGSELLNNISIISSQLTKVISLYPADYLYGMLLADIIIGKRYSTWENHSHNWEVGFNLFNFSETEYNNAFIWGFLSHLAADTVAHNFYIPEMLIYNYNKRGKKHVYWEIKYEICFSETVWKNSGKLLENIHIDNDNILRQGLTPTIFSHSTNKRIFDAVNIARKITVWKKFACTISEKSEINLSEKRKIYYKNRSIDAMADILINRNNSDVILFDPTGDKAIKNALQIRKLLKSIDKKEINKELLLEYTPNISPGLFSRKLKK